MKVGFFSTQTQKLSPYIESDAITFGELMADLGQKISNTMRYYIKENKGSLENPDFVLDEFCAQLDKFTVIASPRNNKAASYADVDDIPTSQLKELKTRFLSIINTLLSERGDSFEEQQEEENTVDQDFIDEINEIESSFF